MDYKKLHKKVYNLMDSMQGTALQIDGLGEEFPDMAKEIDEFFERLEKVEKLEGKLWDKYNSKQRIFYPEHNLTVEYESELIDDLDLFDDIEINDLEIEEDNQYA